MAVQWAGKGRESSVPTTAVSPTLLRQPSCTQGHSSALPFAGWGIVALDVTVSRRIPVLAVEALIFAEWL